MSLAVSYTTHTVEITASGLAVAAIGNTVEVSCVNRSIQVSPMAFQVSVAQAGAQGPAGPGVPVGGTTGQVLKKLSNANLDTGWGDVGNGDMLKSVYDTDNDGKVNAAASADLVPWSGVTGKPSTYSPSAHKSTHASGGSDALTPSDIGAATSTHNHDSAYAAIGHTHSGVYAPASHAHVIGDVTSLQNALDGKASTTHNHDTVYAAIGHNHDGTYAAASHNHDTVYLSKTNTTEYTPTASYHPATKKYVDDMVSGAGVGDMLKSVYDTDNDGKVNAAVSADSVPWSGITSKPSTYSPSAHKSTHASGGSDALTPSDIGAATSTHNHDSAYAAIGHTHSGVYAPVSHTHAIADVTNLQTALDGKASTTHNHDSAYAAIGHNHDSAYAPVSHNHDTTYLSKTNTSAYTPTQSYHPATKKYVDDLVSSSGGGDMLKSVYDTDNDGKVDVAETAQSVPWSGVTDKPSTYTPSAHKTSHATGGTDALSPADIGAATASHNHDGVYSPVGHNHDLTYSPLGHDHSGTYAPTSHAHVIGDVTNLQTTLDGKASTTHSHAISDVTNLQTALDGKASTTHNHDGVYATAGHDHSGVYAPATHSHNDLYYTETEINALFNTSTGHDHDGTDSAKIPESSLSLSDTTTGDVSTSAHGFVPKAPGDTGKFLRGDGTWAAVTVDVVGHSGFDATEYSHTGNTSYTLKKTFTFTPTAASFGTFVFSLQMKTSTAGTGNVRVDVDDVSVFTANLANTISYTTKPSTAVVALPMTAAEHTVKVYLQVTEGARTVYVKNIYFAYIGVKTA